MRKLWLGVPFVLCLVAFGACSSSSSDTSGGGGGGGGGGGDGGGTGSGSDGGTSGGGDTDSGSSGNTTDGGGTPTACMSPAGCTTSGDVCCGTIPITGGTAPNCTTGTIVTVCKAASSCATNLGTTCMGVQTVRLCTTNNDCLEKGDNKCCTFGSDDGGTLSFCANGLIGAFGGGKCM